jgi:hypothetical protein
MKQPYEAPVVTVIGSLQELTLGGLYGDYTDATFPLKTPRGDLTFSG